MESRKGKTTDIKFLSSIIQETSSLRGRIAILTYQNLNYSVLTDKVVIFIEHFQSIILFIYTNYIYFPKRSNVVVNVIDVVFAIVSSFGLGGFLTIDKKGTQAIVIWTLVVLLLFVLRMLIFGYIIVAVMRNKAPSRNIHLVWQWIFKFQPRVIYYLMAPILTNAFEGSYRGVWDLNKGANDFLKVLSMVLLIFEFAFSLILQTQFTCTLPTKNYLSSKNNITQILTLVQKFSNLVLRRVIGLALGAQEVVWIVNILTTFLSMIRLFFYFKYLPAYSIDCLFYQMYFLVVTLALNIADLMEVIFGEDTIDLNLVIGLWVILSILLLKLSINYLKNRLAMMVLRDREKSAEGLIHKLIAAKYFLKKGDIIKGESTVYNWITLVKATLLSNPKKAFPVIMERLTNEKLDMENKMCKNKVFALYLEDLLEKNPQSDFIRLYAAYHFASKQRLYGKCLRTIHELKSSTSWDVDASISVLFHTIQQKIISESQSKAFLFNIAEYVQSTSLFAEAKIKALEQTEHQIRLYQEMKESFPLSTKLYSLGLKVIKAKSIIEKGRRNLFQKIPDHYMEPLLFYAHYYLTLNHSYYKFVDYCRIYSQRLQKFNKSFKSETFCQENFYNKKTAFMIFSGEKNTQGRILYCGGNYEEIFGRNLIGYYFGAGLPPICQTDPKLMMNSILETEERAGLNILQRKYLYHQSGFMTDVECFMNINPYISQGLNYYVIFRGAHKPRECILVNKEGRIECFTKRIGEELGLFSLLLKNSDVASAEHRLIGRICPQLQLANDAFNYVLDFDNKKNNMKMNSNSTSPAGSKSVKGKGKFSFFPTIMSIEEANEICSTYTGTEGVVHLEKILGGEKIAYNCTINHITNNAFGAKEIYLERIVLDFEIGSREIVVDTANQIVEEEIVDEKLPNETEFQAPRHFRKHTSLQRTLTPSPKRSPSRLQQPTSPTQRLLLTSKSNTQREEEVITGLTEGERFDSMSNILSHNESVFSLKSDHIGRNKLKRQKAFEQAIEIPHRPLRHKLLLLLLGCCILFIFGLQFNLNVRISNGFETFGLNKDIVLNAESRNYFLGSLNNFLGLYYTEALGIATVQDFYPDENATSFNKEFFDQIFSVRALESSLMEMANSLSETQAEIFFQKDIRIYDSFEENGDYSLTYYLGNFSNFQATNQVLEASLKAATLVMKNMSEAIPYMQFGIRNILNDILIKALMIAESFYDSLQKSKEDFLGSLAVTFYIVILVPGLGLLASYFLILKQYKIDRTNMLAFSKINQHAVEAALNDSAGFKSFLQQNNNFEDLYKDEKALGLLKKDIEYKKVLKNQFGENPSSSLNSNGFARAYLLQGFNVLVMFLLVFVSFAVYFFRFEANLNSLGEKAHQIYFLERVTSKIILIRACYFELVYLNNTIPIQNDVPMTVLLQQVSDLQDAQHQLQELFSSKDAQENTLVQDMLFGDACKYLDVKNFGLSETDGESSDLAYDSCRKIGHYQNQASWINLIGNIKEYFQTYLGKYEHSNKTAEALGSLAVDYWHNLHYPTFLVSYGVSNLLYAAIDEEFLEISEKSKNFNDNMIGVFLLVVILVGVIGLWGFIFPLMSRENKFKQFLLFFPANAIFSNFMLKSFLMKISIGTTYDSIMQDL